MAVTNLSVIFINENTIILQWMYVIPIEHRINIATVEIDIDSGNDQKATITLRSSETTATMDVFQPLQSYFFSVYVVTSAGRSPPSNISVMTLSKRVFKLCLN